jgi:methylenetetrahydrofolate dehydrogenase (NADP+) / methenyltetrahydrofolate cyclohydrolase
MVKILYGNPVKEKIKKNLIERVKKLKIKPRLLIIQVGNRSDSNIYVLNKINFGKSIGVDVSLKKFEDKIDQKEIELYIQKILAEEKYNGIIVQLPLPSHLNTENILNLIPKSVDADALSKSVKDDFINVVTPATARAVLSLLNFYGIKIKGCNVVVLGKSVLAGAPISESLKKEGAEVVVFDKQSKKEDIIKLSSKADILVSATGSINLVTKEFTNSHQVVIDVGINKIGETSEGRNLVVGDVNFDLVLKNVKAITPVPGGIGVITVACLFENLLDLVE